MGKLAGSLPTCLVALFFLSASPALSAETPALISIIIDDIGYNDALAERALALPGPVSFGILPGLPHSAKYANIAHEKKRDVLLHIPMEPLGDQPLGPGGITVAMTTGEITAVLDSDLQSVPGSIGISNHMGSRFTGDREAIQRFLESMKHYPRLFFLDSLTTPDTWVRPIAAQQQIPVLSRDIFLDNERTEEKIGAQFDKLLALAQKRGRALAIAHPYPETLEFLEQRLHALKTGPVRLVPVSLLLNRTPEK